jgi:hypothetical protein
MRFVARHALAIGVVFAALAAAAALFAFARPEYRPPYDSKTIDMSRERIYSVAEVRHAFAAQGIELPFFSEIGRGATSITTLSTKRVPEKDLSVMIAGRQARVSGGPKLDRYDERFGNVAVSYDGDDPYLLGAIETAASNLSIARPRPMAKSWAEATRVCEDMQAQISAVGWDHWKPLSTGRPLAKVADLRRELLVVEATGLRKMHAHTYAEARALHLYRKMLDDIRRVIRAAASGSVSAYTAANVRMVLSISATRSAFERAGAARICNFAI